MKYRFSLLVILVLIMAASVSAQMPMPKPAPELKSLEFFNGSWSMEGDMKPGPMGPGGKFTGSEHNEWMEGNFFLVSHSDFSGAMGSGKGLAIMGYDPKQKTYIYTAYNSMGEHESATGKLEGDTWTWTNESEFNGQPMKGRYTIKQVSPTSYSFKFEMAPASGDFATVMEGKATKK
jgi:uncharacterized protein DUF1579